MSLFAAIVRTAVNVATLPVAVAKSWKLLSEDCVSPWWRFWRRTYCATFVKPPLTPRPEAR